VSDATVTCPRCYSDLPLRPELKFCPRCGLPNVAQAALDTSPLDISTGGRRYRVFDRLAIGSVCAVYRCRFSAGRGETEGVFKIVRDPCANNLVVNEAEVLRQLHERDDEKRFAPFLPLVEDSIAVQGDAAAPPRQANVLRMHRDIRSPGELYTLAEVLRQYPAGLDARDVAWIWRRLLSILGFVHVQGVVHGAVLPMHVMIEPREHKLILVDWCCAVQEPPNPGTRLTVISGGHLAWYKKESLAANPPTPALDIALGARCMVELLGGDPLSLDFPNNVDPAIQRNLLRCVGAGPSSGLDAWKLLDDFDRLIEVLWGPRQFRVLTMPPKDRPSR
jgi:hypothetical protein